MEKFNNVIRHKEALGAAAGKCLPFAKILAAANSDGLKAVKNKKTVPEICLFVFGAADQKILACYRTYWGSARNTKDSGAMLKRIMAECMEENLFCQYERSMALFCLVAESLPGGWRPENDRRRRPKEKEGPLIMRVEAKSGAGGLAAGGR